MDLNAAVLAEARAQGFTLARIAGPQAPASFPRLQAWLAAGHAGEMDWMTADDYVAARGDLSRVLEGVRSVVVVALAYGRAPAAGQARIASYALGEDYHLVMKQRLMRLGRALERIAGRPVSWRACVDTAPVLERDLAVRAGMGFVGKNTCVIAPGVGSYFVLGELFTDLPLVADDAGDGGHCGRCTTCIDRCPTAALTEHTLDSRRCISYLTIELTGPIPRELRPLVGTWVYGCDICQDVCPYNETAAAATRDGALAPRTQLAALELPRLITIGSAQHRKLVRRTALRRAHREQLVRNACVAAGNVTDPAAKPALVTALLTALDSTSPLVRGHAAWALGRLGGPRASAGLAARREKETDPWTVEELVLACPQSLEGMG